MRFYPEFASGRTGRSLDNLYLCGFMGAGKSTLGPILAEHLGMHFVELDASIEFELGMSISECFRKKGEVEFREIESENLQKWAQKSGYLISLGGGTLISVQNQKWVLKTGKLVYLKATLETLIARLDKVRQSRPLLTEENENSFSSRITKLFSERRVGYEKAHLTVHSDQSDIETTVSTLLSEIQKWKKYP